MAPVKFHNLLQYLIRESGIRQTILAQAMDLSPAMLSQFTNGSLLPSVVQLRSLLDLLCVPAEQQGQVVKLLLDAKKAAGEKIEEWEVEADEDGEETSGTEPLDAGAFDHLYNPDSTTDKIFRETPINAVPVIRLDELAGYDGRMSVSDFAFTRLHDTIIREYGSLGVPVMINTCGSFLGLTYPGMVQLVICDEQEDHISSLRLRYYGNGSFHLVSVDDQDGLGGIMTPVPDKAKPKWSFPVIEFTIIPILQDIPQKKR